jgi:uncharacterized membrane protein
MVGARVLPGAADRTPRPIGESVGVSIGRLEAFSDGVFAVAITLLVLDLKVPSTVAGGPSLAHELARQWPSYAAYVVSFLTIGIIWINHHAMFRRLRSVDHSIMTLNLLLLCVAVLPYVTSLMAAYLKVPRGQHLSAAIYSGAFLLMSLVFAATQRHILFRKTGLMSDQMEAQARRTIFLRALSGLLPYALATALAPVSAYVSLAICGAVAVYYALPFASASQAPEPT